MISHELIERELLLDAAFSAQLALLTTEPRAARRRDPGYLERFAQLRGLILLRLSELRAAEEARQGVERRYLAGHSALFPDDLAAWAQQLKSTETLAGLALGLAEHDGLPPAVMPDPDAVAARVSSLVADLVEPAKVTALEQLGEGQRALGIAAGWVRAKLSAVDPSGDVVR